MRKTRAPEYDERQLQVRGRAFMITFIIFVFLTAILALIEKEFHWITFNAYQFLSIPVWLSITFLYIYCIRHDAYEGLSQDSTSGFLALVMGGAGILVLDITLYKILGRGIPLVENKEARDPLAGVVAGVCMLAIGIAYLMKKRNEKKLGDEEDDDL